MKKLRKFHIFLGSCLSKISCEAIHRVFEAINSVIDFDATRENKLTSIKYGYSEDLDQLHIVAYITDSNGQVMNANEVSLEDIARKNEIKLQKRNNFKFVNEDDLFKEIYENKDKKEIVLKDKDNYFLLYQVTKINNLLPNKNNASFRDKVKNRILLKKKFDLNKNLFEKIQNKDFYDTDFDNLVKNKENIKMPVENKTCKDTCKCHGECDACKAGCKCGDSCSCDPCTRIIDRGN